MNWKENPAYCSTRIHEGGLNVAMYAEGVDYSIMAINHYINAHGYRLEDGVMTVRKVADEMLGEVLLAEWVPNE